MRFRSAIDQVFVNLLGCFLADQQLFECRQVLAEVAAYGLTGLDLDEREFAAAGLYQVDFQTAGFSKMAPRNG